jgi:hypothetical protein
MKRISVVALLMALMSVVAFGQGSQQIIKQRAKELSNQNNVRQGVPPPTQPPTAPGTGPTTPAPQPTALGRLQLELGAVAVNSTVTSEQKQQISRDLIASAQGANKPSSTTAGNLAASLTTALTEAALPPADRSRLIQDLNAVLNGAGLSASRMQDLTDDVQAIFQKNGLSRTKAVGIANDVKAIAAEIQKPATK